MANLKKIANSDFDLNKTVVICGKGETLSKVHSLDLSDKYVVCLNSATLLLDKVDFLVVTDIERFDSLMTLEKNFHKIRNMIVPIQLHELERPSRHTYKDILQRLGEYNIDLYTYCLQSQTMKDPDTTEIDKFRFGPEIMYSTFICSLFWLINAGFRNFETFGIGYNGTYLDKFVQNGEYGHLRDQHHGNKVIPKQWFEQNYMTGIRLLRRTGCAYKIN